MTSPLIANLVARLGKPSRHSTPEIWIYTTLRGVATLNRGEDFPLKKIGQFASDDLARRACEDHFKMAKRGMLNLGKQLPQVHFA